MAETELMPDERGFYPEDYAHAAVLLRGSEALRRAAASNNHNIILAALDICASRRSIQGSAGEGWQPIDSAPKDGTHILVGSIEGQWACSGYYEPERDTWYEVGSHWTDASDGSLRGVSHWQPLPSPPVPEQGSAGEGGGAQVPRPLPSTAEAPSASRVQELEACLRFVWPSLGVLHTMLQHEGLALGVEKAMEMRAEIERVLAAAPLPPATVAHDWFKPDFIGYECCRKCGVVRRRDGKNGPCKGVVRVALREQASAVAGEEQVKDAS